MSKYLLRTGGFMLAFFCGTVAAYLALVDQAVFYSIGQPNDVTVDDGPLTYTIETPHPGVQKSDLFVFVGEKIEVAPVPAKPGEIMFDAAFDARYKVVESIHGEFEGSIIEFRVYDHYGYPPFAKYKHALLFVSKIEGKLYHEKYQFHDVNQTADGRWASCGDPYIGMEYHRKPFTPKPLEFREPIVFTVRDFRKEVVKTVFVPPYLKSPTEKPPAKWAPMLTNSFGSIEMVS